MESDSCCEEIKEKYSRLREQARKWGMTEEEINNCVLEALSLARNETTPKQLKNISRYVIVLLKIQVFSALVVIGFIGAFFLLVAYNEPTQRYVGKTLQPYGYQIFRRIRLTTLPLHNMFNITRFYDSECLVDNPFFVSNMVVDCNTCRTFKRLQEMNASEFTERKFSAYANTFKPVLLKNSLSPIVSYQDLKQMYLKNPIEFETATYKLHSTNPKIASLHDAFADNMEADLKMTNDLHIDWYSQTVTVSVGLRTLFPRPRYIPVNSEVALDKHTFIDSPHTSSYELPTLSAPLQVYTLGSGSPQLLVRPNPACKDLCKAMMVQLEPGDSLLFNRDIWKVYISAVGDELSVGHLISVHY